MKIPFYPNTGDGTHCFQAAMKMALAALWPEKEFTYDELDKISRKQPGKWTWPTSAMLWMIEHGLTVKLIEDFDYKTFAKRGEKYLIERYGEEVGRSQIEHSDVKSEQPIAKKFAKIAPIEQRIPDIEDLRREIKNGVVIVNINAAPLHGMQGYSGHFVVICEISETEIVLHDPGLPPHPNLKVPLNRFLASWAYPKERDKNLMTISK